MVSIQSDPIYNPGYTRSSKVRRRSNSTSHNPNSIDNTLRALALIGISTLLASCYDSNYIGDVPPEPPKTENTTEPVAQDSTVTTTPTDIYDNQSYPKCPDERIDNILNALGLLENDTASITNIKTLCCSDSEGFKHWLKPKSIYDYMVSGEGLTLTEDDSEAERYSFIAKNGDNGSLNVIRTYKDGSYSYKNYKLEDDGTVVESNMVGNSLLKYATYKKEDDGTIIKTLNNGGEILYNKASNNIEFPIPI